MRLSGYGERIIRFIQLMFKNTKNISDRVIVIGDHVIVIGDHVIVIGDHVIGSKSQTDADGSYNWK